jgi:hypothetical protein
VAFTIALRIYLCNDREGKEMVVLISLGFFVRTSLAGFHKVRMSSFAHTFWEACDVARRFGWRKRIVGAGGRSRLY